MGRISGRGSGLAFRHTSRRCRLAGVGRYGNGSKDEPLEVIMASAEPKPDFERQWRRRESNPRKISIGLPESQRDHGRVARLPAPPRGFAVG
jgi:hypothetical protein